MRWTVVTLAVLVMLTACVSRPAPAAAVMRETPPPWDAPRDAVSYISAADLREQPLDAKGNQRIFTITVTVDGEDVTVPANVGVDRLRAVQAVIHTHDASGTVWLEGDEPKAVTLQDFFTLWGVRFDERCLGAACGSVTVIVDGVRAADPMAVPLRDIEDSLSVQANT